MQVRLTKTEIKQITKSLLKKLLDTEGEIRDLKLRIMKLENEKGALK